MTDLITSDITLMDPGFCVIGLEHDAQSCRSVRPLPPRGNAWRDFPFKRGDVLRFDLTSMRAVGPHVEDRASTGVLEKICQVPEEQLVDHLRHAEVAHNLRDLFVCDFRVSPLGGSAVWVARAEARRSICGGTFENIRFQVYGKNVRAELLWSSGGVLRSLPLVDRDWRVFLDQAQDLIRGANRAQRFRGFLDSKVRPTILDSPSRFARIGIIRGDEQERCWLMLDSLFPLPQPAWLEHLK